MTDKLSGSVKASLDSVPQGLRIVYMGTPDFAVGPLKALLASAHTVVGVVTNPDRPSGRGKKLTPPPVKVAAIEAGVEVYQPPNLRGEEAYEQIGAWAPDVIVVAAYGQILRQRMLDLPRLGCINIHASLLPKYRGAAPINWCIVRGEDESGVTIMQMERGLDTGPMLLKRAVEIGLEMSSQDLHDELSEMGSTMIVEVMDALARGPVLAEVQEDELSSYAPMLTKEAGRIDWARDARVVHDHIRGFNPWPGAYSEHLVEGGEPVRIKFHRTIPVEGGFEIHGEPGQVLVADSARGELVIACGRGAVRVLNLQAPGKRAMDVGDFLRGYELQAGMRFEIAVADND